MTKKKITVMAGNQAVGRSYWHKSVEINAIRQAVADYMWSEGCSCCRGPDHDQHAEVLAKLLDVPPYDDNSGYQFHLFRTVENDD